MNYVIAAYTVVIGSLVLYGLWLQRVTYIWAPWAKESGIKNGDYIVSLDGYAADMTIRQFQAYLHLNKNWGDTISVTVRRGRRNVRLTFRFPEKPPNR